MKKILPSRVRPADQPGGRALEGDAGEVRTDVSSSSEVMLLCGE